MKTLSAFVIAVICITPLMGGASAQEPGWHAVPSGELPGHEDTALTEQDQVIFWNTPQYADSQARLSLAADSAFMLVDADYSVAQPAVESALKTFGDVDSGPAAKRLADWDHGWFEVLISRRPDLCEALKRKSRPALEQLAAREDVSSEYKRDTAQRIWRNSMRGIAPQERKSYVEFHATYPSSRAVLSRSYGVLGRGQSQLVVELMDVLPAFGHPATGVRIYRIDTSPNVGSGVRNLLNVGSLGGSEASVHYHHMVPATEFNAVLAALSSVAGGNGVKVAASPSDWALGQTFCSFELAP